MTSSEPSTTSEASPPVTGGPGSNGGSVPPRATTDEATAWEAVLTRLAQRGGEILAELRTLLLLRAEESRLRLRRMRWRLVQFLLVGAAALSLAAAGGVYLARGLARGLAASLPGRPWLGELLAGALLLLLLAGGVVLARALEERRELQRLRKEHGHDDEQPAHEQAADGGAAPGTRAGPREGAPGR